jgi:hypothetical protein
MSVKELRNALIKKVEVDGHIPMSIEIDGCFMIVHAVEKLREDAVDKITETEDKVLVKKIKKDPLKYYKARSGKINMCKYVPEYKEATDYRNQRHHSKYNKRIFDPKGSLDMKTEKAQATNLDSMKDLIITD